MTLDSLGFLTQISLALILPALLLWNSALTQRQRLTIYSLAIGWFLFVAALTYAGVFSVNGLGVPAIAAFTVLPAGAALLFARRSASMHEMGASVPLALLVLLHVGRLVGGQFLLLEHAGRLNAVFAETGGWGDIAVALTALPVAALIHRRTPGWRTAAFLWNLAGLADFAVVLTLGVGSISNSPFRFIFSQPPTDAMGTLPWFLIPGFLVPFYLITHVLVFLRLAGKCEVSTRPGLRTS